MKNQPESPKAPGLRKITPHKGDESGGRTISKRTDVTLRINKMLHWLKINHNISLGDIVAEATEAKYRAAIAAESDE